LSGAVGTLGPPGGLGAETTRGNLVTRR